MLSFELLSEHQPLQEGFVLYFIVKDLEVEAKAMLYNDAIGTGENQHNYLCL